MAPHSMVTAFAPASVGNVAVGFDLLGHVIAGVGDRVTARPCARPGVHITSVRGVETRIPHEVERNTAGAAARSLLLRAQAPFGVELELDKGIALGSGMGGSAASAVAAVVAVNALLAQPLSADELYVHALDGEEAATGARPGDNVGPMLLGGLVLATRERLVRIPVPAGLWCALVHPHCVVETKAAREVLRGAYALNEFVAQSEHLALVLAGCHQNDRSLVRAGLADVLIEPRRAALVPGFAAVKGAALDCGALGASISGAGPSVFAWCDDELQAQRCARAMQTAFAGAGLGSDAYTSPVAAPSAHVVAYT
jgi:homoserine kinase